MAKGRGYGSGAGGGGGGGGPQMQFSMMAPMTPVVKALIIANVAIWLGLQLVVGLVAEKFFGVELNLTYLFGLVPNNVIFKFFIWEPITYMFLHSANPFHILFNMLLLWWLGGELEQRWGSRFFTLFYMVSGIGAGLLYILAVGVHGWIFGNLTPAWTIPVVGASGAIFGLMLAYGIIFGERVVYFMMLFPMRAKYFVMILGAVEVVTLLNSGINGGDVANLAHVGGLISGFVFLRIYTALQQRKWRKGGGAKARGRGLKLVVNNDGKKDDGGGGDGPKYWN
jgi:membrane associated rhomboid family serine protease